LEKSKRFKERRAAYGRRFCSMKSDEELFESRDDPNEHVKKKTESYNERKEVYSSQYYANNFEGQSS
jgi:hypothetical protein